MVNNNDSTSAPAGLYDRPQKREVTGIEVIAVVLSLIWLLATVVFFLILEPSTEGADSLQFIMTMVAIFMPVALIWVAAMTARSSRVMREEGQRINAAVEGLRQSYMSQAQASGQSGMEPTIAKKLDEIAAAQRKTETAIAMFSTTRETQAARVVEQAEPARDEEDQGLLALGTSAEELDPPISNADLIRAMHFPENAEDQEGFNALRKALKDRQASQLVQAAQDVLTLLSQDGIYMDDLRPDLARPEIWRQFAEGIRGREIAALGGVRDRSSLALSAGRMKQDPIFRDAAHHFLRRFDKTFVEFEKSASDQEITALSETRTARAFMLLGRVAGIFD
ncbi:hypothetical protein [Cognatishimia activa]|uniref:Uncharacterized protein n=1 Tax=Cognatishimia activa TaxID=1715691 RepID=A0A0P1IRK4_9RHOB|nr:hypothetical protein [Cognatishimia activa]MEE2944339.1 hypothetical protein [Pseudomonadota bacterium]CUJ04030.1 hypothetical protein TA5113_02132 [Cognatishimia activa]CUK26087.1 hypothetical protein TA5114_01894 [Cognatishimia activa]